MKSVAIIILLIMLPMFSVAEEINVWTLITQQGEVLTQICYEPSMEDEYISADNRVYRIVSVEDKTAVAVDCGSADMPSTEWMDMNAALPVMAASKGKRIGIYCTHSDESYEPSDGYYSTRKRGSIYQIAQQLAQSLQDKGIEVTVEETLHHPHDAGAYRRSRQTAIQLIRNITPDCLIDVHRDGIPNPDSYAVMIGGEKASKIRLLVGRGNQNAALNKEFALLVKAVADRVYPGLIKDIYMGKGAFNQDLLPVSILLECGTYTLEKERVLASMPMMADVLNRALYGGITGSASHMVKDVQMRSHPTAPITQGEADPPVSQSEEGIGQGFGFLGLILGVGIVGIAVLSAGSWKRGLGKSARNISEMTGGLIGKKPDPGEKHDHS